MESTQIKYARDGRYLDAGFMLAAIEQAQDKNELRQFRVKYQPARCACCGKRLQTGMQVVSPERGKLIGRCCWWRS